MESLSKKGGLEFFEIEIFYIKVIMYQLVIHGGSYSKNTLHLCLFFLCFFAFWVFSVLAHFKGTHLSNSLQAALVMSHFKFGF